MFKSMHLHTYMQERDIVKRYTISVSDELKEKLDAIPDINWAFVAKEGIEKKLSSLEKFEMLERNGEL